jgi:hypothetical protein
VRENDDGERKTHLDMNWRRVWFWSAVISAPLALAIAFGILGDQRPLAQSLRDYLILWVAFEILLTPVGVLAVFRATFDPAREFAERQRARQGFSENAPVAVATTRLLTWIAKTFGRAGNRPRN